MHNTVNTTDFDNGTPIDAHFQYVRDHTSELAARPALDACVCGGGGIMLHNSTGAGAPVVPTPLVCLSVYPSVPALTASASVETSKQRYSWVSLLGLICVENLLLKRYGVEKPICK